MPLPDKKVVSAFIESYLAIRKESWYLNTSENTEEATKNLAEKPAHKLAICIDVLKQINNASTFDDWLNLLDDLFKKEKADEKTYNERYTLTKLFASYPLICHALHAARTYIISEIKDDRRFKRLKDSANEEKIRLEKDILWDKDHRQLASEISKKQEQLDAINITLLTRDDSDSYYLQFFNNTIKAYDPVAKNLDEKTFEHFKTNVVNEQRKLTISERLMKEPDVTREKDLVASEDKKEESKQEVSPEIKPAPKKQTEKSKVSTTSAHADNSIYNTRSRRQRRSTVQNQQEERSSQYRSNY